MQFMLLLVLSIGSALSACPNGTLYNEDSNRCYKFVAGPLSFADAEINCTTEGGHLTSVENAFVNSFVYVNSALHLSHRGTVDAWIGLNDQQNERWQWTDGSSFSYFNWAPGQTDSPKNQCVSMGIMGIRIDFNDGYWIRSLCDQKKPFVCAIPSF